ncbi:hypothetical protein BH10PAT2_BH10PAT2_0120 [soil metagenome]
MKSKLTAILTSLFVIAALVLPMDQAFAQTTTQLNIATVSGATYLTTTTISTSSTAVVTATPVPTTAAGTPVKFPYPFGFVLLPSGFFPSATALTNQIFKIVMVISIVLVFAYLVLGGIEYITSGGEKAKTEAARNKITSAIIGLIIVASSYAILTVVLNFIGYKDTTTFLDVGVPGPAVVATPLPAPLVTPTPTSALQKLLQ